MIDPTIDEDDVVEGERLGVSELTGAVYRTTRWIEIDDGSIKALDKEELTEEQIEELSDYQQAWISEQLQEVDR